MNVWVCGSAIKAECRQVRGIQIVLTSDPDQREKGIAARIGQRRSQAMRGVGLADAADRPVQGHPLS
jgi:hypothetical protein